MLDQCTSALQTINFVFDFDTLTWLLDFSVATALAGTLPRPQILLIVVL